MASPMAMPSGSAVLGRNVQGKAPPLRKLTALRKAFPTACYPLLCVEVSDSRRKGLSLEETLASFAARWAQLGHVNPPGAVSSSAQPPLWPPAGSPDRAPGVSGHLGAHQSSQGGPAAAMLAAGVEPEPLREGMAVFRGLLLPAMQQWLVQLYLAVGDSHRRSGFGCFESARGGRFALNYGHRAQYIDELSEFPPALRQLQAAIRAAVLDSGLCGDAPASVAIINYYGGRSNGMGWHVDADMDPPHVTPEEAQGSAVVSLSVGDACDFCYRTAGRGFSRGARQAAAGRVRLESGDVVVFGGPSRQVEHCVDGLYAGTRPKGLKMPPGRINITFRNW